MNVMIHFDGGARPNPGNAASAAIIEASDGKTYRIGRFIGVTTNNVAEYQGLLLGLEAAQRLGASDIVIRGDSKLVVKQFNGRWRINESHLAELRARAVALAATFRTVRLEHVPRHENAAADSLCNEILDSPTPHVGIDDLARSPSPRRIIYLAGPIAEDADPNGWRTEAKGRLARLDLDYRCPIEINAHLKSERLTLETAQLIVRNDLAAVDESNAILVHYPKHGHGTSCEMFYAKQSRGIPVVVFGWPHMTLAHDDRPMSAFLKSHADRFVATQQEAIHAVADILEIPLCNYCSSRDHLNDGRICQHGKPQVCCDGLHFDELCQAV